MSTMVYNSITYDENYDPEDLAESVYSYAEALPGQEMEVVTRRPFEVGFTPVQVTVNGGVSRRVGCVIADDRMRYIVFDLDEREIEDDEEAEDKNEDNEAEQSMAVDDETEEE